MNLFYKPSLSELASLIEQNTRNFENYNVIVDFDGEVIIDSDSNLSLSVLGRYKFYFSLMSECYSVGEETIIYFKYLNQLFKNLVFCWDKDLSGKVDYQLISNVQSRIYHKEARERSDRNYTSSLRASV